MTRKLKSVEIELADEVQQAVLSLPVQGGGVRVALTLLNFEITNKVLQIACES